MKYRSMLVAAASLMALAALFGLFFLAGETRAAVNETDLPGLSSPTITTVQPDTAPNDVDTPIVIQGTGFTATISGTEVITAPAVYLGDEGLADVVWGSTTTLSTTVPWGLIPEVYSLTVVNPDGVLVTLPNAVTVTDGFGQFVTGGPYGGFSVQLEMNPADPATLYALMYGAGLFTSEDAGENWELIADQDQPITPTIMLAGTYDGDLFYSINGGDNWTWSTQLTGTISRLYFNPYAPLEAWAVSRTDFLPNLGFRGHVYRSTNLTNWTALNLNPQPGGPSHAQMDFLPGSVWLAAGSVYSSTNDGST